MEHLFVDLDRRLGGRALGPFDRKRDQRQIHLEHQAWRDVADTPRSGHGRMVPMRRRIGWTLRKLGRVKGDTPLLDDDGKRFEPKRLRGLVRQAQLDAGLEATGNGHLLRHTFRAPLAMARIAPIVIHALAGHKHLTTTMRYMHVVPGGTDEAIRALHRPLPPGLAPEEQFDATLFFGRILVAT